MSKTEQSSLALPDQVEAAGGAAGGAERPFEIKGSVFSLLSLILKVADPARVEHELAEQTRRMPGFFSGEPMVIDCRECAAVDATRLSELLMLLRRHGLRPVGVCNADDAWRTAALEAGLGVLEGAIQTPRRAAAPAATPQTGQAPAAAAGAARPSGGPRGEGDGGTRRRSKSDAPARPAPEQMTAPPRPANVVDRPVRTGQRLYAQDADLTLLDVVNPGAEVLADGSIHAYAPLRGRALAGVRGDTHARIFTRCLEAELVSIAGVYRVLEDDLGPELRGKPAQVYLDGEKLIIAPL